MFMKYSCSILYNIRHAAEGRHLVCGKAAFIKGASRGQTPPFGGVVQ
jgi:hypothetical protein